MLRRIREAKNNESGFTLIELLIVIVILGILAAIVVFAVGAFNKNGQEAACKADFKSVQIADDAFFAKTGGYAKVNSDLVPNYLDQWPQTDSTGAALPNAPYTITLDATGKTGPSAVVGSTTTASADACTGLS
jgi:prepilin-type N-terminal cleavage/methylation domain-containing protein